MTETEFLSHVKQLFDQLALRIEADFPDFDVNQHGAILEIENDDGAKIIINQQTAMLSGQIHRIAAGAAE